MDGKNFLVKGYIFPTIEMMIYLFAFQDITIYLGLREHGTEVRKKRQLQFAVKLQNCHTMVERLRYGVTVNKQDPFYTLMNALMQHIG